MHPGRAFHLAALSVSFVLGASVAAPAAEPIRADCLAYVTPANQRTYDDETHRNWYRRYWTGQCEGLGALQCFPGQPNWNGSIATMIRQNSGLDGAEILSRACTLGEMVGYEWARDNAIRCIDTSTVKKWGGMLRNPSDLFATLDRIRGLASARLGCR